MTRSGHQGLPHKTDLQVCLIIDVMDDRLEVSAAMHGSARGNFAELPCSRPRGSGLKGLHLLQMRLTITALPMMIHEGQTRGFAGNYHVCVCPEQRGLFPQGQTYHHTLWNCSPGKETNPSITSWKQSQCQKAVTESHLYCHVSLTSLDWHTQSQLGA